MLRIRFFAVAAATLSVAAVVVSGSAAAQTASTEQNNAPLSLLHLFNQSAAAAAPAADAAPPQTATRPRRVASRRHRTAGKTEQRAEHSASADPAQSNASADAWLAASTPPSAAAPADPTQQDNPPPSASAAVPGSVVIDGQTVQIAEADQVNEIDLAAGNASAGNAAAGNTAMTDAPGHAATGPTVQSTMELALPRGDRADTIGAAQTKAMPADAVQAAFTATAPAAPDAGGETIADLGPLDSAALDSRAQSVNDRDADAQDPGAQNSSAIGGAARIAQVLAALGGAVTAGIVAWFLIGAEPVRTYG